MIECLAQTFLFYRFVLKRRQIHTHIITGFKEEEEEEEKKRTHRFG
jgi:hypothetical protein